MGLKQDPVSGSGSCPVSGKAMLNRSEAKSLAKRARTGNPVAYKCRTCGKWHVGNQRKFTTPKPIWKPARVQGAMKEPKEKT